MEGHCPHWHGQLGPEHGTSFSCHGLQPCPWAVGSCRRGLSFGFGMLEGPAGAQEHLEGGSHGHRTVRSDLPHREPALTG